MTAASHEANQESKRSVLINFILDKSGSMDSVRSDTIGGFNSYLDGLSEDDAIDYRFSLTLFDTHFENRFVAAPLREIPKLDDKSYVPGGMTALYDAIGSTVRAVEAKPNGADRVLTVILTDGHENSSKEHTLEQVKRLIEAKEREGNWTFVFLGASPDAWDIGVSMGVQAANSVQYDPKDMRRVSQELGAASVAMSHAPAPVTSNFFAGVDSTVIRRRKDASGKEA